MKRVEFSTVSLNFWMVIVIVLLFIAVLLSMVVSNIAPRIAVLSQLFSPDAMSFGQAVEATNMKVPVKESQLIDEMFVRMYIESRHEYMPQPYEMTYRWGPSGVVARLSAPTVYRDFAVDKGNFTEKMEEKKDTTSIDITHLDRSNNTFTVDFNVYVRQGSITNFAGTKRAVLMIRHDPGYQSFASDFANPYGFVVISYKETVKNQR